MALTLPDPSRPAARTPSAARAQRHWQRGQGDARRGEWAQAAHAYAAAAALDDDVAYGLAATHALIKSGCSADAVQRARQLRQRRPAAGLACTLEAHALLELGRAEEAIQCLRALPAEVPRDHAHLEALGTALQRCQRHDEAMAAWLRLLALKIDDAPAHFRLGLSFLAQGMKQEAAECMRTALLLGLGDSELAARAQLAFLEREACQWAAADATLATLRRAVRAVPDGAAVQALPFVHAVLVDDAAEQLKLARHHALHLEQSCKPLPRRAAMAHDARLRIGYLSADFHQHATSQLMAQMLECHDRRGFEVTLLSAGPDDGSRMRERIVAACEHFVDLRGQTFEAMAEQVRARGIDILVDLKGATHNGLLSVMAHRSAPLQVSWLGFPGTSGASCIDYVIGDTVVTPLAHAAHFSEKLAQLPHCYQPNDAARALPRRSTRAEWGAAEGALLLCAFHQPYKISAPVFDLWCELLHALPGAVLWLLEWNPNLRAALTQAALARGIDPARLLFAPVLGLEDHLTRLACADVFLDAWPCNAHTTAGEALWTGVPVVTLIGATFAQRVAGSLLHAVSLDELVCADARGYRDAVLSLAADPQRRARIRSHLEAQRSSSPLFDGARQAREIERLYLRMWDRATRGLPAEHLAAQPLTP